MAERGQRLCSPAAGTNAGACSHGWALRIGNINAPLVSTEKNATEALPRGGAQHGDPLVRRRCEAPVNECTAYSTRAEWRKWRACVIPADRVAGQGHGAAQSDLGWSYRNGWGVIKDGLYAPRWFNVAAAQETKAGANDRDKIAQKMTPADLSGAEKRARGGREARL